MVHQRRAGRERCAGCGFGKGQFQVEYEMDDGSGRGYCSLDCYTSAKVTGRNFQTQARGRGGDGMPYHQQQQRGAGGARGYGWGGAQPRPWPTGFLVDAPPTPKPWRGRTLSQDSMSWRTVSTGNLSVADESSSQESSVADWHGGESEDGEASVGSANDSGGGDFGDVDGSGGAAALRAPGQRTDVGNNLNLGNRRHHGDSSGGRGGGAAVRNVGSGGTMAFRSAGGNRGGEAVWPGGQQEHRLDRARGVAVAGVRLDGDGGGDRWGRGGLAGTGPPGGRSTRGEVTHRPPVVPLVPIPVVPLAPIPRLGAFPAQRRAHETSGGGRRVPVRTVAFAAPPARAPPPPRQHQQQTGMTGAGVGVVGGAPYLGLILEEGGGAGGGGDKHPPAVVAAAAATAAELPRREAAPASASPSADVAAVAHPQLGDHQERGEEGLDGPKSRGSGDVSAGPGVPREMVAEGGGAAGAGESETATTGSGVCAGAGMKASPGSNSGGQLACGGAPSHRTASAVSTKVAVRQWRRLFLP